MENHIGAGNGPTLNEQGFTAMRERLFVTMIEKISLAYVHNFEGNWPPRGVLRIEIHRNLAELLESEKKFHIQNSYTFCDLNVKNYLMYGEAFLPEELRKQTKPREGNIFGNVFPHEQFISEMSLFSSVFRKIATSDLGFLEVPDDFLYETFDDAFIPRVKEHLVSVVEYSVNQGFLRLAYDVRREYKIPTTVVRLDAESDGCFSHIRNVPFIEFFITYEDSLMTTFRHLDTNFTDKGAFKDLVTGDILYQYVHSKHSKIAYIYAFSCMLIFTIAISLLLRFSHQQIFVFIMNLLHMFELNEPVSFPVAPLLTVILALVGMEALMAEIFLNTSTAFYIIMIVWIADQFDAIVCRTSLSKKYWLRFFYFYHFCFYCYRFSAYSYFPNYALFTSAVFILHSMLYFFHKYELNNHIYTIAMRNLAEANIVTPLATSNNNEPEQGRGHVVRMVYDTNNETRRREIVFDRGSIISTTDAVHIVPTTYGYEELRYDNQGNRVYDPNIPAHNIQVYGRIRQPNISQADAGSSLNTNTFTSSTFTGHDVHVTSRINENNGNSREINFESNVYEVDDGEVASTSGEVDEYARFYRTFREGDE
uniref:Membralin n=1 Tax=Rhabditophanes sp. KR3021 TaxID=114890 RepID=A0AC35U5P9_9BILA